MITMPKMIITRQGIALRADFAGKVFLLPADLNFAIALFSVDRCSRRSHASC